MRDPWRGDRRPGAACRRARAALRPSLWSIVFPLGLYAVAGAYLGRVDQLPLVRQVGTVMIWVASAVWILTFLAMLRHLLRSGWASP